MKSLETDPAARYQRVSDFAAALEEAVGGGGMLEKLKGKFS
jgi:hypothetical protein